MTLRDASTVAFGLFVVASCGYTVFSLVRPILGDEWAITVAGITGALTVLAIDHIPNHT